MNNILTTMKQAETPLNTTFFCRENFGLIQRAIRQVVKDQSGVSIDYQKPEDVLAIMRYVYINNAGNQYLNIEPQVKQMNGVVIHTAVQQINTNLSQFYGYANDLTKPIIPPDIPMNTSLYGDKIGYNDKIGI